MFFKFARADAPENWQLGFQDPASPIMEGMIDLHHDIMFFLVAITIFVLWMLTRALVLFHEKNNPQPEKIIHGTEIEIGWTIAPSLILVLIAVPSFALLYSLDEVVDPAITLKVMGIQWLWQYEYSDYSTDESSIESNGIQFESYMIPDDELEPGQYRLLETDNRVVLPVDTHIRVLVTGSDVIHSWAIPSLGVKTDALPGRLNQTSIFIKREGVFYGQCSEICGFSHGMMPITIEAVSLDAYKNWVSAKLLEG
uniref:Cytochrome c oxidase subunit 2 n=1 Tax=Oltmannsiellopsis viridis TaxID=51324 RepID=Q0QIN7_OLTVI|nr:cytochrome c oxidase subunit 2 [Oltmannsiellopsis viridis]ABC96367.1 cytochrome c oxidase subunit 2 [Oltmannsiellopsis viridis]